MEEKILNKMFQLSKKAANKNEVPIAAVLVYNNKIIASAYNRREKNKDITAHAEVIAIKKAAKKLKRWNLNDCILYVSLKPCAMCYEIIKQSRIPYVYYFLEKPSNKKEYSKTKLIYQKHENFACTYQQLLSNFFRKKR